VHRALEFNLCVWETLDQRLQLWDAMHSPFTTSTMDSIDNARVVGTQPQTPRPGVGTLVASVAVAGLKGCVDPSTGLLHVDNERCAWLTKSVLTADPCSR